MPAAQAAMMPRGTAGMPDRNKVQRVPRPGPSAAGGTRTLSLGRGEPLPANERAFFEARFGEDFSAVRLHADATAGAAALGFDARAFTLGRDIAFAPGEYAPGTAAGKRLLAHELVHVVQQAGDATAPAIMRKTYGGCDGVKLAGDEAAATIDRGRADAMRFIATARAAFPQMGGHTIDLLDRHFHCPTVPQIQTVIAVLAAIEAAIPLSRNIFPVREPKDL
jgi:hypothetical protein